MFRKSFLLLSLVAFAALIAWGVAPGGSTPACASATSAQSANCALQLTVNQPSLTGTPASPNRVGVTWNVTNVPPCFKITGAQITFTVTRNNAPTIVKVVNVSGNNTNGGAIADLGLGQNLPPPQRPNAITAEVRVTAEAIDPVKHRTESNTKAL